MWFALICGVLLVVPLAVSNGVTAGCVYLASLGIGLLGNVVLRQGLLLLGALGGGVRALSRRSCRTAAGAVRRPATRPRSRWSCWPPLLGVGVHVLCALPGLVADHEDGCRHLPLRLALKIGATRLLVLALAVDGARPGRRCSWSGTRSA